MTNLKIAQSEPDELCQCGNTIPELAKLAIAHEDWCLEGYWIRRQKLHDGLFNSRKIELDTDEAFWDNLQIDRVKT